MRLNFDIVIMVFRLFGNKQRRDTLLYTKLDNRSHDLGVDESLLENAEYLDGRPSNDDYFAEKQQAVSPPQYFKGLVWMNIVLFFLSSTLFISAFLSHKPNVDPTKERNYCLKQTSEPCMSFQFIHVYFHLQIW